MTARGEPPALFPLPLLALALLAFVLGTAPPADGALTPPAAGDWFIESTETVSITSGTTVVTGNVTVNGSLSLDGATLQLDAPAAGVVPRLFVQGSGVVALVNSTVAAGPSGADRFAVGGDGGTFTARGTSFLRLGATSQANLTLVGMHFIGTTVTLVDSSLGSSDGGIGLSDGATLLASNLALTQVRWHGLVLANGAAATVDRLDATGVLNVSDWANSTDYILIVDKAALTLSNSTLGQAVNAALLLASPVHLRNVTLGTVGDVGALMVGSNVTVDGGAVIPHARTGLEAYASALRVTGTVFHNFTTGVVLVDSQGLIDRANFDASTRNPLGAFNDVYAFDSVAEIVDTTLNGRYIQTWIPVWNNTTMQVDQVPVYSCTFASIYAVHSAVRATRLSSTCFSEHFHGDFSDLTVAGWTMDNGTTGLAQYAGTVSGAGLRAANFAVPGSAPDAGPIVLRFYQTTGTLADVVSLGNDNGAEFTDSSVRLENFTYASPGLAVRVISGAPTVNGSTFTLHNSTAIVIRGGTPVISNSSFRLTADRMQTYALFLEGGYPLIVDNVIRGSLTYTYGVRTTATGSGRVERNTFEGLDRAAMFYSVGFVLANNTFTGCYVGADSREGSSGLMVGNEFRDLTLPGEGSGVRIYFAATTVERNRFINVTYGAQVSYVTTVGGALTRLSANSFENVRWFAVQVLNATLPVLLDNNTVRNATGGAVEVVNGVVVGSYNLFFDMEGYGYAAYGSALTLVGDRLENLTTGVLANQTPIEAHYTTFARTHLGIITQDGSLGVYNGSFQFNGIAVEVVNRLYNEVVDSIFVGNVEGVLAFSQAEVTVRDSSFVGTLDAAVATEASSYGRVLFTRHGELNGGRVRLAGPIVSTAPSLTLKSLAVTFTAGFGEPAAFQVQGPSTLTMANVRFLGDYAFELALVTGSLVQVNLRGVGASPASGRFGPVFDRADLSLRDVVFNESTATAALFNSTFTMANVTVRDNNASGLFLSGSTLRGAAVAVLDNQGCGVEGTAASLVNLTNLTVRANTGGSLCFSASRAQVTVGDFASAAPDVRLDGGSNVGLVSVSVLRGWVVNDTSVLTQAWVLTVLVNFANAAQLPDVLASVVDGQGLAYRSAPGTDGVVVGLPPLPQWIATSAGNESRNPYTAFASLRTASASVSVTLARDMQVQLDLVDSTPPTVTIETPAPGQGFAASKVTLRFFANDSGSGVREIQFRFGAGASTALSAALGVVEIARDLVDGDHTFTVRATDFAGNSAEASVSFLVDTRAPLITLVSPKPSPYHTRAVSLAIQVTTESDVVALRIGGVLVPVVSNSASLSVDLPEGATTFRIEAEDRVGNRANISVTLVADRTPPPLQVDNVAGPNLTVESFVIVHGTTEPGALVLVGGYPVVATNGTFDAFVVLAEGPNEIEVRSRDALGNENVTRFSVSRGTLAPSRVFDVVFTMVGAALLLAAAGAGYYVWSRPPPRRQAPPPYGGQGAQAGLAPQEPEGPGGGAR